MTPRRRSIKDAEKVLEEEIAKWEGKAIGLRAGLEEAAASVAALSRSLEAIRDLSVDVSSDDLDRPETLSHPEPPPPRSRPGGAP